MDIGTKLYEARRSSGLTQEQAAEALNVSRQTLSNWENNKTYPDILKSVELSDLYNIPLDSLLKSGSSPSEYAKQLASVMDLKKYSRIRKQILVVTIIVIALLVSSQVLLLKSRNFNYNIYSKYQAGETVYGSDVLTAEQYDTGYRALLWAVGVSALVAGIIHGIHLPSEKKWVVWSAAVIAFCGILLPLLVSRMDPFSGGVINFSEPSIVLVIILIIAFVISYIPSRRKYNKKE